MGSVALLGTALAALLLMLAGRKPAKPTAKPTPMPLETFPPGSLGSPNDNESRSDNERRRV